MDYNQTVHLPQTDFPMRAGLPKREPELLNGKWEVETYHKLMKKNEGKPKFVLHDGPPYANGHIHIGTALNKILKDIIIRYKNMTGFQAPYVPGWDTHGLPIESAILKDKKIKRDELTDSEFRDKCRDFALNFVDIQRSEFQRLGVIGDWENPYLTLKPEFEAKQVEIFGKMAEKGYIYKGMKPVYWCPHDQTALAEAEIEYADDPCTTIFVKFPVKDDQGKLASVTDLSKTYFVIWTTTPWTIPGNYAISVNPDFDYVLLQAPNGEVYILAEGLVESVCKAAGLDQAACTVLATFKGSDFELMTAKHPLFDRESVILCGDHVTLDAGTGCVHTAPGHGREDYEVGLAYKLDVYSPLDDAGRFLPSVEFFAGLNVFEANPKVIEKLTEVGALLKTAKISHSYPHCWRCKQPVIFRATTQWFISMEKNDLRKKALNAIDTKVQWIPAWGRDRIYNMIESRPDWCISRQRQWGVPIMALLCKDCGEAWNDAKWMHEMADRFAKRPTGCDYWYEAPLEEIVPEGLKCPHCGGQHWEKEDDILDVWFDSGTSFAAVLESRPELSAPADLYLEGSDQHRGWFHSSLLVAEGTRNDPPYKAVLTHGYVVDGDGRKMSKSIGNVIAPQELIDKYGAEIVRLWVSSVEYREDIRISEQILGRLVDAYRRIRNTCRFILGTINDLTRADLLPLDQLLPLDRYALHAAAQVHDRVQDAYMTYDFHKVYHTLHNYCVTDLSAVYLDILKDRLYSSAPASKERRSAQTALYHLLCMLVRDMAPVLSFTAEEIFHHLPNDLRDDVPTVFALPPVDSKPYLLEDGVRDDWNVLLAVRGAVTRAIEPLRRDSVVGHSLDTSVTLYVADELRERLEGLHTDLRAFFIVSQLHLAPLAEAPADAVQDAEVAGLAVGVAKAAGEKCERCWIYSTELGSDPAHPTLCPRCAKVMAELPEA